MNAIVGVIITCIIVDLIAAKVKKSGRATSPEEKQQDRQIEQRAKKAVEAQNRRMQPKNIDAKPFVVKESGKKHASAVPNREHKNPVRSKLQEDLEKKYGSQNTSKGTAGAYKKAQQQPRTKSVQKSKTYPEKTDAQKMVEAAASGCNNIDVHSEVYDERKLIEQVYDAMVLGPNTQIPGERDFITEGLKMISMHTTIGAFE